MRRLTIALLAPLAGLFIAPAFAAKKPANAPLLKLFDQVWQEDLIDDPIQATALGDTRYNDKLPDMTQTARAADDSRSRPKRSSDVMAPATSTLVQSAVRSMTWG